MRSAFLILSVLISSTSHAMGEGERLLNFKFNLDSHGTYMADLDVQRELIQQEYNNKFLQEKIAMEREQKERIIDVLNHRLNQLVEWIEFDLKLQHNCKASLNVLSDIVSAVQVLNVSNTSRILKIANLAHTLRQEADIKGLNPVNVEELVKVCNQYESATSRSIAVCRLISLFDTQSYKAVTQITPDEMNERLDFLAQSKAKQTVICNKISMQLHALYTQQEALSVQRKTLQEKK